jgi:hypothetical protein
MSSPTPAGEYSSVPARGSDFDYPGSPLAEKSADSSSAVFQGGTAPEAPQVHFSPSLWSLSLDPLFIVSCAPTVVRLLCGIDYFAN